MDLAVSLALLLCFLSIFLLIKTTRKSSNRLPPGSLGIPIIGQSLRFLRAMKANTAEKWLEERVEKYGPISKMTLFGTPTVFIHGQAANKFVFASDSSTLNNQQPQSVTMILGKGNLSEVSTEDHNRIRRALMTFLKPEVLKQYVGKMDMEMRKHVETYWQGKQMITVLPITKNLTFSIMWSVLFGLEHGARRDKFMESFHNVIDGLWAIPLNLPFTRFNRSLKSSSKIRIIIRDIIREKRLALETQQSSPNQDLITSLLSIHGDDSAATLLSDDEIVDNIITVMVAGYDTSSVLITFMVRLMATDPVVYSSILHEQEEIAKMKTSGELTWEDLTKMKYTWTAALEILRISPPVFGGFRKASKDVEFGGYLIPKGWQVFWAANMTHRDELIFPEPLKFDPRRSENQGSIPPYCFVAFGGGQRVCPGYEFARIEVLVAVHYLVTKFTWKLCGKVNNFSRNLMPVPTQGLPIQIEPKKVPIII